jgi:hypothetical protein
LSDLKTEKAVHLYVSKEKATNDIAPSNHSNESVNVQDGDVSAEGVDQLIMRRPQSNPPPELEL